MRILMLMLWMTGILAVLEIVRELHIFKATRYRVSSAKLAGLRSTRKIIFLSDLHNYCYGRDNDTLFHAIEKERPDLILVGGDMLLRKDGSSYGHTVKLLSRVPSGCPVYHANGNHEQKMKERPKKYKRSFGDYKRRLEKAGVRFLENESVTVKWGEGKVRITGLEIPLRGYERRARNRLHKADIEAKIGTSKDDYEILMAHHPAHIRAYRDWGADLILSGHYHGGVCRFSENRGLIAPNFHLFPAFCCGHFTKGRQHMVVSPGLGEHTVRLRIHDPRELIMIELVRGGGA